MAIETFTWPTQHGDSPEISYRVRTSQFGGGYKQEVGDGPNNKEDAYPITYSGVPTPVGGGVFKLTATFERAFHP